MTAAVCRGEVRLTAEGRRWRTRYRAPLFVNVLPCPGGGLLAAPVDQGGGLRNGERHLQRVALAAGAEVTWAPPASTVPVPGSPGGPDRVRLEDQVRLEDRVVPVDRVRPERRAPSRALPTCNWRPASAPAATCASRRHR